MDTKPSPEQIITDLGGCGRFQMIISVIAHAMKTLTCWTMTAMVIIAKTPPWWCVDDAANTTGSGSGLNGTSSTYVDWNEENDTAVFNVSLKTNTSDRDTLYKSCTTSSGERCANFRFGGRSTIVSEFNLVCDYDYIPSLIMSLVAAGSLVGNPLAGQIADLFGRKRPFFASVLAIIIANIMCYLSTNWTLFAVARFFTGIGHSTFITTLYSLLSEFTLSRDRAWVIGIPSWPIESSIFVGLAWLLQEWRYMQLACVIVGFPCLLAWRIIPESFRFHLAHDRPGEAEKILAQVAKFNKKPHITLTQMEESSLADTTKEPHRTNTFLDIFRTKYLLKVTLLLAINWFTLGFCAYGIKFGVQAMSGNIFLNMFLFSVNGIPVRVITPWLENRIGRRVTGILSFTVVAIGGYLAGITNYIDTPNRGAWINGFALLADTGLAVAISTMQIITIEQFPTVIRSVGFGTLNSLLRVGAIIGPQFVFLSTKVPGLLYFCTGVLATLSVFTLLGLTETRNKGLSDKIKDTEVST